MFQISLAKLQTGGRICCGSQITETDTEIKIEEKEIS
jgi:hypothetical protein